MTATMRPAADLTERWTLDPSHTTVGFAVRHLMIAKVKGRFSEVGGTLELAPADLARSRVEVEINAASIDSREPKRDEHLRSPDFLDANRFPTLRFVSRRILPRGTGRFDLIGDLTIRDITREVRFEVVEEGAVRDPWGGARRGYSATGRIDRRDFGLTWNLALEAGGVTVGHEVDITLELEWVQQD